MKEFGLTDNDISNGQRFNKKSVTSKYHRLAKKYHPDRQDGDGKKNPAQFMQLLVNYGILLQLLDKIAIGLDRSEILNQHSNYNTKSRRRSTLKMIEYISQIHSDQLIVADANGSAESDRLAADL